MADEREPDGWQAQFVAQYGSTTRRLPGLVSAAPLRSFRENLPIGTEVGDVDTPIEVTGPYIRLTFSLPEDTDSFTFSGGVRIYRKPREFSRDILDVSFPDADAADPALLVYEGDFSSLLDALDRGTYGDLFLALDQNLGRPGTIWYYTVFYEGEDGWAFDPAHSHTRNWGFAQTVDADEAPTSSLGGILFDYLPGEFKITDAAEGGPTEAILQAFGRLLDRAREELLQFQETKVSIEDVDHGLLPYIDWLLAWPTNYELPEGARRRETIQAAELWKAKGIADALELVLQTITGWNVTIHEGWKWTFHANPHPAYDADEPPDGWDEETDGVWSEVITTVPVCQTVNVSDPRTAAFTGTPRDLKTYLPSNKVVVSTGVGWHWQNPNGLAVVLSPAKDPDGNVISKALPSVVVRKVYRIAPLFALHYAAFSVILDLLDKEEYDLAVEEDSWWAIQGVHPEEVSPPAETLTLDVTPDRVLMYSWAGPDYGLGSILGSRRFITYHSWLHYEGQPTEDLPMPQYIMLSNDQYVDEAVTTRALGQFAFNPAEYDGSRVFRFGFVGSIGGPGSPSMGVKLWNLTDDELVTGTELSTTATDPTRVMSNALTVGASAGNMRAGLRTYEVRVSLANVGADDFGLLGNAFLQVA